MQFMLSPSRKSRDAEIEVAIRLETGELHASTNATPVRGSAVRW
jgi:hypothetical protein